MLIGLFSSVLISLLLSSSKTGSFSLHNSATFSGLSS